MILLEAKGNYDEDSYKQMSRGFGLSGRGIDCYCKLKGCEEGEFGWGGKSCRDIPRDDPALIQVVDKLGEKSYGQCAILKIVEIPDGVEWQIEEYDGLEWVAEKHRTWG